MSLHLLNLLVGVCCVYKPHPIRNQPAGLKFRAVRDCIDPGGHRFRRWVIGVVNAWKDLGSGDGILSSRGAAGSTNPSRSAIGQWGWGFPRRTWRYRSRFIGVVDVNK